MSRFYAASAAPVDMDRYSSNDRQREGSIASKSSNASEEKKKKSKFWDRSRRPVSRDLGKADSASSYVYEAPPHAYEAPPNVYEAPPPIVAPQTAFLAELEGQNNYAPSSNVYSSPIHIEDKTNLRPQDFMLATVREGEISRVQIQPDDYRQASPKERVDDMISARASGIYPDQPHQYDAPPIPQRVRPHPLNTSSSRDQMEDEDNYMTASMFPSRVETQAMEDEPRTMPQSQPQVTVNTSNNRAQPVDVEPQSRTMSPVVSVVYPSGDREFLSTLLDQEQLSPAAADKEKERQSLKSLLTDEEKTRDWWKSCEPPAELSVVPENTPAELLKIFSPEVLAEDVKQLRRVPNPPEIISPVIKSKQRTHSSGMGEMQLTIPGNRASDSSGVSDPLSRDSVATTMTSVSGGYGMMESLSPIASVSAMSRWSTSTTDESPIVINPAQRSSGPRRVFTLTKAATSPTTVTRPKSEARPDAPAAQVTSSAASIRPSLNKKDSSFVKKLGKSTKLDCASCYEEFKSRNLIPLDCQHQYCKPCMKKHILACVTNEAAFPPRCCGTKITLSTIHTALTTAEQAKLRLKAHEYDIPYSERVYCPAQKCGKWIPKDCVPDLKWKPAMCPFCATKVCQTCHQPAHPDGMDCPDDHGLDALLAENARKGWKRCYNCRHMVELTEGCDHVSCKCGAQFCYTCGLRWKTCECQGDEEAIRREQQQELEMAQEVTRQMEEMEAAESFARAQEQERQDREARRIKEDLRRQQEEARSRIEAVRNNERNRAEQSRLAKLTLKYDDLTTALESVFGDQGSLLLTRLSSVRDKLAKERQDAEAKFQQKTLEEQATLDSKSVERSAAITEQMATELEGLDAKQEEEEDEIVMSMTRRLRGTANCEQRIDKAVAKLKMTQQDEKEDVRSKYTAAFLNVRAVVSAEITQTVADLTSARHVARDSENKIWHLAAQKEFADEKWFEEIRKLRHDRLHSWMEQERAGKSAEEVGLFNRVLSDNVNLAMMLEAENDADTRAELGGRSRSRSRRASPVRY